MGFALCANVFSRTLVRDLQDKAANLMDFPTIFTLVIYEHAATAFFLIAFALVLMKSRLAYLAFGAILLVSFRDFLHLFRFDASQWYVIARIWGGEAFALPFALISAVLLEFALRRDAKGQRLQ